MFIVLLTIIPMMYIKREIGNPYMLVIDTLLNDKCHHLKKN